MKPNKQMEDFKDVLEECGSKDLDPCGCKKVIAIQGISLAENLIDLG